MTTRKTVITLGEPAGEIVLHDLDVALAERVTDRPYRRVLEHLRLHGELTETFFDDQGLKGLFDEGLLNVYDTSDPGVPRVASVGHAVPVRVPGLVGKPLRETQSPKPLSDMLAYRLTVAAEIGQPLLHHVDTSYNGHVYDRLLVPVIGKDGIVRRVVTFCPYPSPLVKF